MHASLDEAALREAGRIAVACLIPVAIWRAAVEGEPGRWRGRTDVDLGHHTKAELLAYSAGGPAAALVWLGGELPDLRRGGDLARAALAVGKGRTIRQVHTLLLQSAGLLVDTLDSIGVRSGGAAVSRLLTANAGRVVDGDPLESAFWRSCQDDADARILFRQAVHEIAALLGKEARA
jgi:hypothetical protein